MRAPLEGHMWTRVSDDLNSSNPLKWYSTLEFLDILKLIFKETKDINLPNHSMENTDPKRENKIKKNRAIARAYRSFCS